MNQLPVKTDAAVGYGADELGLELTSEVLLFGKYRVAPMKLYVLACQHTGVMEFADEGQEYDAMLTALRMLSRWAIRKNKPLDYRIYKWNDKTRLWDIHVDTVVLGPAYDGKI